MFSRIKFSSLLLSFFLLSNVSNAQYDTYNWVHVTYTYHLNMPALNGYRYHFQDGLVLSQEKTWNASFVSRSFNWEGQIGEGDGFLFPDQSHTVWYRSRVINPLAYETQFFIFEAKKVYPDYNKNPHDFQQISRNLCRTDITLSALWWLAKDAQIKNFETYQFLKNLPETCGTPFTNVNWGDAFYSQTFENDFEKSRELNINFNFVSSDGFHAKSNENFAYQAGLEDGKNEKIERHEFPVFDAADKNRGLCTLYIRETKSEIAIYSLFSNYEKAEGGFCNVGKQILNKNIPGVGDVASGVVIPFKNANGTPQELTDVVIALSPPSVVPMAPFKPANYIKSDKLNDKFYNVVCLNDPNAQEIQFWEEYDTPGSYTNGISHFRYNGQGPLNLEQARKDIGQAYCKLPIPNYVKSINNRDSYYDVTCVNGIASTFYPNHPGTCYAFTNGAETYDTPSTCYPEFRNPTIEEFNKLAGQAFCKIKVNDPYGPQFPSTYVKSDAISGNVYKVICLNDPNAGETIFWETKDTPFTYTNGIARFAYHGTQGLNLEQARKDIGQPFCKLPPPNYVKSSQTRDDNRYYDVSCVNDISSTFYPASVGTCYGFTNGSETFNTPSTCYPDFRYPTLEEFNRWVGQVFCKLKVNNNS